MQVYVDLIISLTGPNLVGITKIITFAIHFQPKCIKASDLKLYALNGNLGEANIDVGLVEDKTKGRERGEWKRYFFCHLFVLHLGQKVVLSYVSNKFLYFCFFPYLFFCTVLQQFLKQTQNELFCIVLSLISQRIKHTPYVC